MNEIVICRFDKRIKSGARDGDTINTCYTYADRREHTVAMYTDMCTQCRLQPPVLLADRGFAAWSIAGVEFESSQLYNASHCFFGSKVAGRQKCRTLLADLSLSTTALGTQHSARNAQISACIWQAKAAVYHSDKYTCTKKVQMHVHFIPHQNSHKAPT